MLKTFCLDGAVASAAPTTGCSEIIVEFAAMLVALTDQALRSSVFALSVVFQKEFLMWGISHED
jgi:hypothetical protein